MTEIFITRHGETQWNLEGRFQGRGNSDLTERGRQQAQALGPILDREAIDLILTSPLKRARETAKLARGDRPIDVLVVDSLCEFDLGAWEGLLLKDLADKEAENYHNYWNDPFAYRPRGGETYAELIHRMEEAMAEVVALAQGHRTLVITHGMALMAILQVITGADFNKIIQKPVLRQTSLTKVRATSDGDTIRYEVDFIGDTAHLADHIVTQTVPIRRNEEKS